MWRISIVLFCIARTFGYQIAWNNQTACTATSATSCSANAGCVNNVCKCNTNYYGDGTFCEVDVSQLAPGSCTGLLPFQCLDGTCKPTGSQNDGVNDCTNGEDEDCYPGSVKCSDGRCPNYAVLSTQCSTQLVSSGYELEYCRWADGFLCASQTVCIPWAWVQNGISSCPDGSDEWTTLPTTTGSTGPTIVPVYYSNGCGTGYYLLGYCIDETVAYLMMAVLALLGVLFLVALILCCCYCCIRHKRIGKNKNPSNMQAQTDPEHPYGKGNYEDYQIPRVHESSYVPPLLVSGPAAHSSNPYNPQTSQKPYTPPTDYIRHNLADSGNGLNNSGYYNAETPISPPRLNESQAHLLPTNTPAPVHGYIPHLQGVPMRQKTGLSERSNSDVTLPMMSPMPQTPKTPKYQQNSNLAPKDLNNSYGPPLTPVETNSPDAYYTHTPKPQSSGYSPPPSYYNSTPTPQPNANANTNKPKKGKPQWEPYGDVNI